MARLEVYLALLQKWNRAINLVSKASLEDPWRRHVLDSAQLWPIIQEIRAGLGRAQDPLRLVDLGSGAGFPGLVLGILAREILPESRVILVESDQRKAQFLAQAIRELGALADPEPRRERMPLAMVRAQRIEEIRGLEVDFVTARALAPLAKLLPLAAPFLRSKAGPKGPATGLFLKGRGLEEELTSLGPPWHTQARIWPSLTDTEAGILEIRLLAEEK